MPSLSRPARGAWVEMKSFPTILTPRGRRAPQGARGLKYIDNYCKNPYKLGRAPQGARGLK